MVDATEIRGLVEAQAKLQTVAEDLRGGKVLQAVRESALLIMTEAKLRVPVDTGRLRASILSEVRMNGADVLGVVGTVVAYARDVEFGTKPHVVPIASLETWARRKGISAEAVASAIAKRGTKGKRYMEKAFQAHEATVRRKLDDAVARITQEANK